MNCEIKTGKDSLMIYVNFVYIIKKDLKNYLIWCSFLLIFHVHTHSVHNLISVKEMKDHQ